MKTVNTRLFVFMMTTSNKEREINKMTAEEQDYEHLSKALDSYVICNDEARREYVRMELLQVARLRNVSLEVVVQEVANAVGREADNLKSNSFLHQHMVTVERTLIELLHPKPCKQY